MKLLLSFEQLRELSGDHPVSDVACPLCGPAKSAAGRRRKVLRIWDDEDFITYNRGFHFALAHASGNRRMAASLCDLIGQADRLVRVSVANLKGHDPKKLVAEHVALIEAMQTRDSRTAARIIKAHIGATEKRVLPALKRNAVIVEA